VTQPAVLVGRLTVRGAHRGGAAGARSEAESFVRQLDQGWANIPDRTVLVVRRLEVVGVTVAERRRKTRAGLADLRRGALRPALEPVATTAAAVLFQDEAELLTCLTRDLVSGSAAGRWYWSELLRSLPASPGPALAAVWVSYARWLPAALAHLELHEAASAVALVGPGMPGVRQALLAAFEVPYPPGPHMAHRPMPAPGTGGQSAAAAPGRGQPVPPQLPWQRWISGPTTLNPDSEAFLGLALGLHHAPAAVRRLVAKGEPDPRLDSPGPQPAGEIPPAVSGSSENLPTSGSTSSPAATRVSITDDVESHHGVGGTSRPGPGQPGPGQAGRHVSPAHGNELDADKPGRAGERATDAQPRRAEVSAPDEAAPGAADQVSRVGQDGVASDLATMLFLVNFLDWLDAPGTGVLPEVATGWATVELLARHLLGARMADMVDDTLWDVLAQLDGRAPGSSARVELGPEDPLWLPQPWLERWPPNPPALTCAHYEDRFLVTSDDGSYVVSDLPGGPERRRLLLDQEVERLRRLSIELNPGAALDHGPAASPPRRAEERFGASVGQFVAWLLRSRGITVDALTRPGRIAVTGTHLDVLISLEHVDLAVRMAGLDRDPGWMPDLGRIVLFHFVEASPR